MIQEDTISHYLDEVLEQDDAFSDVGRIAGPDQRLTFRFRNFSVSKLLPNL